MTRSLILNCGLEIHCQLFTRQKLFSGSQSSISAIPNSCVSFFDAGIPGSLPLINQHAVKLAIKTAIALNCKINNSCRFDRKHYFYADQPHGYQITQHYYPLACNGHISVESTDSMKACRIGIKQIQLEQDTGKTILNYNTSLINLNRAGSALIEIVTLPSIHSASDAGSILSKIQSLLRSIQTSEAQMECGQMRCDVNVSIDESPHCEIKNVIGIKNVVNCINTEYNRQKALIESKKEFVSETRGFDDGRRQTYSLRDKETQVDYRYMPDADIPRIILSDTFIETCKNAIAETSDQVLGRLMNSPYSLTSRDAQILIDANLVQFYISVHDNVPRIGHRLVVNWIIHDFMGCLPDRKKNPIHHRRMAELITLVATKQISTTAGKRILSTMVQGDNSSTLDIASRLGFSASVTDEQIQEAYYELLKKYPDQANQLQNGKAALLKWFVGQIMQKTGGNAVSERIHQVIRKNLCK